MKILHLIQHQIQTYWKPLALFYLVVVLFLLYIGLQDRIPAETLTRDIASVVGLPFYVGVVSQLGLIFWSMAATASFLTFIATSNTGIDSWTRYFCLYSAILTIMLMLDDMLLIHEQIFPEFLSIPESVVKISYMVLTVAMVIVFYTVIVDSIFSLFILAMGFFFISMALDSIPPLPLVWRFQSIIFEDSAKFLGIVSWCVYYCVFCFETVRKTQSVRLPMVREQSREDLESARFAVPGTIPPYHGV